MLLEHLGNDLVSWREHLFITQSTHDIHYLDSSFFSSCMQIEMIIGNKEENTREEIEQLAAEYPVWLSDIATLAQAVEMIRQVGLLVGREERAQGLANEIEGAFAGLPCCPRPYRVGYFIWQKPYMAVGQPTFIHDMLSRCGFVNAFAGEGYGRYPELTAAQIHDAYLDMILLSSEPFPFGEAHQQAFTAEFGLPVHLVDGEMFSWYGSRLVQVAGYLAGLVSAVAGAPQVNPR
jgi:hypothetical protein